MFAVIVGPTLDECAMLSEARCGDEDLEQFEES